MNNEHITLLKIHQIKDTSFKENKNLGSSLWSCLRVYLTLAVGGWGGGGGRDLQNIKRIDFQEARAYF